MAKEKQDQGMTFESEDMPLLEDFVVESNEHVESAEVALLELENTPENKELLNQIFRAFHTIKGLAGFLGLSDIGALAHSAENLLDLARKDQLTLIGDYVDVTFESIDSLKKLIEELDEAIKNNSPYVGSENTQQLIAKLDSLCDTTTKKPSKKTAKPKQKSQAAKKETVKSEESPKDEEKEIKAATKEEAFLSSFTETPETETARTEDPEPAVPEAAVPETEAAKEFSAADQKTPPRAAGESKAAKNKIASDKIKVSTNRLDYLVNTVGELVIAQLMLSEDIHNNTSCDSNLLRKITHQGKIVRELQELSMSMRMVPICEVFQKMNRLARDLSRKADKNIVIEIEGEETELDRTLVDKIADPLVHMVRNSVDHGIEMPEERAKKGKNETGTLALRAFHQSGKIIIEVEDDGKGLDKERILTKALDLELIEKGQDLSDEEIFKLIFHPGFSTAQKVTSVSGRGVGMDVVKKNIESLRGKVSISSTMGKGTKFTIQLPLTLAIIDGQIVKVGQERYIIPINSISYSFKPLPDQIFSICDKDETVMVQDQLYPLVRLYESFNIEPQTHNPCEALIVLVEDNNQKYCLLVDELLDQQQVVIKNLGEGMEETKGFTGGAIMGDGQVSLILDIPALIELTKLKPVEV